MARPPLNPGREPRLIRITGAALLIVATLLCYIPVLRGDFIWDDDRHVSQNRTLQDVKGLRDIWLRRGATVQYYPLTHTSFWLEYRFWGLNPTGYHVTNVLLHGINAVLGWILLRRLDVPGAFFAAAVFAVHPIQAETVAWITERKNLLATCLVLISILAYRRGTWLGYSLSLLLFACALLSKTITCSMPAVMVLLLWWKRRLSWQQIGLLAPFFVLGLWLGLATARMETGYVGASGPEWDISPLQRSLIASRAVWFYVGKLLWPVGLTFNYPRWEIDPRDAVQYVPLVGLIAGLGILALTTRRLGRGPLAAVLIYIGSLFPALGFFNTYPMRYSFVADHFQYLSSIAMIALAVSGIATAWNNWLIQPRIDSVRMRFAVMNGGLLLLILGVLTWRQAQMYVNDETLWRQTLRRNPASWMAHNNLGAVLSAEAYIDSNAGRTLEARRHREEAMQHFESATQLKPDHFKAMLNRGELLEAVNQLDEALRLYVRLAETIESHVARFNNDANAHGTLGYVYGKLRRFDEARVQFELALRINPNTGSARRGLELLEKFGQPPTSRPATD